MNKLLIVPFILLLLISCNEEEKKTVDVSDIDVTIEVDRFERKFYNANVQTLPLVKKEYPFLFPKQYADSIWLNRISSEEEIVLFKKSEAIFNSFEDEKNEIENVFKHIEYYFPKIQVPKVLTLITNLDFENKVMFTRDYLFISLDLFLGKDELIYNDFPKYISQNFDKSQIKVEVAKAVIEDISPRLANRQFIDLMINEGKKMYLIDAFVSQAEDFQKIGYSKEKMDWAVANEVAIWKYIVENDLLYSTDRDLYERFIADAPFSKFYLDLDKYSPGKIGVFMGWQIVRSYMQNNNVTLQQMLAENATDIFKKSKYKPKK